MLRPILAKLVIAAVVAAPAADAVAAEGSVDLGWGGLEAGRVRVPFDTGGNNSDQPSSLRVLADGRLVAVGSAAAAGNVSLAAVAVRKADGTADTSITPTGRYTVAASGFYSLYPTSIAADGSWYAVGTTAGGQKLRISHYALDGTPIGAAVDIGAASKIYWPNAAIVDVAGRLLVGGYVKASGAADSAADAFVLRLTSADALDPAFGIRTFAFDAARRDDVTAITEVGDETYAVCGRVGDLADSSSLAFGIAHLGRGGNLLTDFNGTGMYVDQLALQGHAAESGCTGIAAVPSAEGTHLVITGRASADTVFPRTYLLAVDAHTGATLAGTPDMLDFGVPDASLGFPRIQAGANAGDRGLVYVATAGTFDASGRFTVAIARLDPLGAYDTGWGNDAHGTKVVMSVPAIGGTQRALFPAALAPGAGRIYLAAQVLADDVQGDFALVRFVGDTIFAWDFDF